VIVVPYLHKVVYFAFGVKEAILSEKPYLQFLRHLLMILGLLNFALTRLKVPVGLLGVVDRRYEVFPVVTPFEQSGIGCKKPQSLVGIHHQHAEHLSLAGFNSGYLPLYLFGSQQAERVGFITERPSEPLGF
jgi:hypothetical protein